jgi:hypothetical protein
MWGVREGIGGSSEGVGRLDLGGMWRSPAHLAVVQVCNLLRIVIPRLGSQLSAKAFHKMWMFLLAELHEEGVQIFGLRPTLLGLKSIHIHISVYIHMHQCYCYPGYATLYIHIYNNNNNNNDNDY